MNVIIVHENDVNYSELDNTIYRFTKDKIEDDIEEHLETIKTNNLLEEIVIQCKFTDSDLLHSTKIHESKDYVYYLIHLIDDVNFATKKQNKIATYLLNMRYKIYGKVGIMKEKINFDMSTEQASVITNNILEIYRESFVHTGLIIDTNNNVTEYEFMLNPIDNFKPEQTKNLKFIEIEIFGKIMVLFIDVLETNINEKASILLNKKVCGRVLLSLKNKKDDIRLVHDIYTNVNSKDFDKLLSISSVDGNELAISKDETSAMKIESFHTILEYKYIRYVSLHGSGYLLQNLKKIEEDISVNEKAILQIKQHTNDSASNEIK